MNFDDMAKAINQAESTLRIADNQVNQMARIVTGRLESAGVSVMTLCKLKRELENFNMHTKTWKQK